MAITIHRLGLLIALVVTPFLSSSAQETIDGIPAIGPLVEQAIAEKKLPGAVVLVGKGARIVHRRAYGLRQVVPEPEAMTCETIFDLASLTKPVVTATSVLILKDRGKIDLSAAVASYLPEFGAHGKETITVEQLLTHTSGLPAGTLVAHFEEGPEIAWTKICELRLKAPPGEAFIYSDIGFITLGFLVEKLAGESLADFAAKNIFQPLQMHDTRYQPAAELRARIAPTEQHQGVWLRGVVHDPRARALGEVAGHAGLFSTADDLSRYARMILNRGELDGARILQLETVDAMLVSRPVPGNGLRTWGWDRRTTYSKNRGDGLGERAIGHGGFTGTGLWIDPDQQLFLIVLSSRLHPDGKGLVNPLIGEIGTAAVKAVGQR